MITPFLCKLRAKKQILKKVLPAFFLLAYNNFLKLIVSPNIFHWKSVKESKVGMVLRKKQRNWYFNGFFHILHELYIYKQKVSGYRNTWVEIEDYIS